MEAFVALLAPITGEFPSQRPVTRSFDIFFDLRTSMFLWCGSACAVKQTAEWPVIWDYMTFTWRHRNVFCKPMNMITISRLRWVTDIFPVRGKEHTHHIYSLYRDCWWPGDVGNQGISGHGIELSTLEYSSRSTKRFFNFAMYTNAFLRTGSNATDPVKP